MKALNVKNMSKASQQGFTIIELVVVILLLGILTATALPRFLDVTDEAHDAVIDATRSGMQTAAALFRAQWVAENQPNDDIGYGPFVGAARIDATTQGYPAGVDDTNTVNSSADCVAVYDSVLQTGRPLATAGTSSAPTVVADITGDVGYTGNTSDFIAIYDSGTADVCSYYYAAQKTTGGAIEVIEYDSTTGAVSEGTSGFVH